MRRTFATLTAFVAFTGTLLVLPVYAAPGPAPTPVNTSTEEVAMGSVEAPAADTEVQEGTTEPVSEVPQDRPTLTVARTDVDPFSLVGVTWAYDPQVTDTVVQVRVQDASGSWGSWTEVGVEDADQNEDAAAAPVVRGGTAPLWTGPSTGVEAELVTRSGAQPVDVRLELVDPGRSSADTAVVAPGVQGTAHAGLAMPPVYSRAQWGADERLRTWAPEYAPTIRAATLHHTADTNNYSADQVPAMLRSIYRYHAVSRGWGDIGYNVLVDKFGQLWEGRYGGLSSTVIGAHAGGFNTGTFGVSMIGNYDETPTTSPMIDAVAAVIAWKLQLYGVDPQGTVRLTSGGGGTAKYAAGVAVTLPTIFGHRDVGNTSCPGQYGYAQLPAIRAKVTALMNANSLETIDSRYRDSPDLQQLLGAKQGAEQSANGVTWQVFDRGRMYSSPGTGVHAVVGAILDRYVQLGGPIALGAPTTDELPAFDGVGRYSDFAQGASLYWRPGADTRVVLGNNWAKWKSLGADASDLGFPTSDEQPMPDGVFQAFSGGGMYWTPAMGSHEVHGLIGALYLSLGGPLSGLGIPVSDETVTSDGRGRFNHFTNGASIYWSPQNGAQVVLGDIRVAWARLGWEAGAVGYPTSGEQPLPGTGGVLQSFTNALMYWSPATMSHEVQGWIGALYVSLGGPTSLAGFPITDETVTPDGRGRFNHFANGASIYWSPSSGAHVVYGAIRDRWAGLGWELGTLGYPTSDERSAEVPGARVNDFLGGRVYWSPGTGAQPVFGAIGARYLQLGAETSALGLPTSGEYAVAGGLRQDFQHGTMTWTRSNGRVVVG